MEPTLLFIGVLVSLVVQAVKKYLKTTTLGTLLAVAALSVGTAAAVYFLKMYGLYESILQILATAGAFYAFIIRIIEKDDVTLVNGLVK